MSTDKNNNNKGVRRKKKFTKTRTLVNTLYALSQTKRGKKPQYNKKTFRTMMNQVRQYINLSEGGLNSRGMDVFGNHDEVIKAARTHRKAIKDAGGVDSNANQEATIQPVIVENNSTKKQSELSGNVSKVNVGSFETIEAAA